MHELSICQSLLVQVEAIAQQHGAQRVTSITLHIGPLSGVEADLLQHAFTLARAGGVAEGATLAIEILPVRVSCQRCGQESEAAPNRLLCGHCGDYHTRLLSGDEMLLASVELDVDVDTQPSSPRTTAQQQVTSGGKHV
jgi:hydrogenase nickel incorporation protein HypA/HybF